MLCGSPSYTMNSQPGILSGSGPVEVHTAGDDGLEFTGKGWRRTVRLKENVVTVEQTPAVPADRLGEEKRGNVTLSIERVSPSRVIYSMK